MLQTFWSVNIFFSLCLAFSDFCVLYIVRGKAQQKLPFRRDIEWEDTKGFGTIPTRENPRPTHSVKTGILRKGYPFPMLAAEVASGKWVLICCACSLLKTKERTGKETKNQRRTYCCEKSAVSRIADARNHNAVRQNLLSLYGKLRRKTKSSP